MTRAGWILYTLGPYGDLLQRNPEYRLLWLSDVVSSLGEWFSFLGVLTVLGESSNSSLLVSALLLTRFLPQFFLSPVVGLVLDWTHERIMVMICSNAIMMVFALGYLLVRGPEDLYWVYLNSVIQFSASAFFEPAHAAVTPSVVHRKDLLTANALDTTTWSTMLAAGSFVGGLVVAYMGPKICFIIDSSCFFLSNVFLISLRLRQYRNAQHQKSLNGFKDLEIKKSEIDLRLLSNSGDQLSHQLDRHKPVSNEVSKSSEEVQLSLTGLSEALQYFRANPTIFYICFSKATDSIVWGCTEVANIRMVETLFPLQSQFSFFLGITYLVVAVGNGFGPIAVRWIPGVNSDDLNGVLFLVKLSYIIVFAGVSTAALAALPLFHFAGNFIRCNGNGVNYVYSAAYLQLLVPENFRGRVFAFEAAMNTLALASAQLLTGFAIDDFGLESIDVLRVLTLLCLLLMLLWMAHFHIHERLYSDIAAKAEIETLKEKEDDFANEKAILI